MLKYKSDEWNEAFKSLVELARKNNLSPFDVQRIVIAHEIVKPVIEKINNDKAKKPSTN